MTIINTDRAFREPGNLLRDSGLRKAIGSTIRPYRWGVLFLGLVITTATILPLVQPLIYRVVIDRLIEGSAFRELVPYVVAVAVLPIVAVALTYLYTQRAALLGRRVIKDLQMQLYHLLTRMPLEFFTTLRGGAASARLTTDVYGTEPLFTRVMVSVVANTITLLGAIVVLAVIDYRLALILLVIPFVYWPVRNTEQRINQMIRRQNSVNTDISTTAESLLSTPGMTLARQSGQVDQEVGRFEGLTERLRDLATTLASRFAHITAGFELTFSSVTAVVFVVGAWFVSRGDVTLGTLVLFLLYIRLVQGPITALSGLRYEALRAGLAFDRVFEVLRSSEATAMPQSNMTPADGRDMNDDTKAASELVFEDVRFEYARPEEVAIASLSRTVSERAQDNVAIQTTQTRRILNGVSFTVSKGESVAIVGQSGAGKSTIALLASGLYHPTGGAITVGGRSTQAWQPNELAQRVALITQDTFVLHDSIKGNLAYVDGRASDEDMLQACQAARLGSLIAALPEDLDTIVGERGYRLSGGERQRLAIARALLKNARLIILDEPTSQLDTETERLIKETTDELFADRAVLTIAHRLSTIRDADRILVLSDGRIVEEGTHEDLIGRSASHYRTLYMAQAGGQV